MTNNKVSLWRNFFIGFWIITVYIICIFLVVYSLSSYQFQVKLNTIPYVNDRIDSVFIEHECDLSSVDSADRNSVVKIPCLPNNSISKTKYYSPGKALAIYKEVIELTNIELSNLELRKKSLLLEIEKLKRKSESSKDVDNLNNDIDNLIGNLYTIELKLKELVKRQKNSFVENEHLIETFSDIEYFESFFGVFSKMFGVNSFWAMPRSILELVLIMSMGVLGSLMFVTISFINEKGGIKTNRVAMYIFRPSLGMIVALSVYVMAKSGQSTFTGNDTAYLSPFLISFLGIISGILAEKAYAKLAQTGRSVLNTSEQSTATNKR